jgi:hypothetical protein
MSTQAEPPHQRLPNATGEASGGRPIGLSNISLGGILLRWSAPRQRRVLYVDGEMPFVSLQERLRAISTGLGAVIPNDGFRILAATTGRSAVTSRELPPRDRKTPFKMPLMLSSSTALLGELLREFFGIPRAKGSNSATFIALLLELGGVDRMMFSVDHLYQSMAEGRAFLEQLPVSAADKERIAYGNAEKLFKL